LNLQQGSVEKQQ